MGLTTTEYAAQQTKGKSRISQNCLRQSLVSAKGKDVEKVRSFPERDDSRGLSYYRRIFMCGQMV